MSGKPTYEELEQRVRELEKSELERKQLEEALKKSEALLAESQRIAHVGSWVFDINENRLTWSDETYRIFGLEPQEFEATYEAFLRAVHPDDRAEVDEAYSASLRDGSEGYEIEHRIVRRPSGEVRCVQEKCTHERDETGKVFRSTGIVQDITERRLWEEVLREREERFRFLAENMGDIVWTHDMDLNVTYISPSVEKVLGFTPEERKMKRMQDMVTPESLEKIEAAYAEELEREKNGTADPDRCLALELEYYHRDGSIVWLENIVKARRDESGRIAGIYGVSRDISRRKKEEKALRTMAEMLDNAPSSITVHDERGRFLYANRKTFDLHGYEPNEFLSMSLYELDAPESSALINERLNRIKEQGEARFEAAHYRKDGTAFPLEVLAKIIDWKGQPAVLSIADDISDRKRRESSLQTLVEQLEAIFDCSMVGIALLHNRIITKANRRLAEMLGFTAEEIQGLSPEQLHLSHEHFVEFGRNYYSSLAEHAIVQVEYPLRHKNGETVWCLFSGRAISPPDLSQGVVWAIDDITERKTTEQALRESEEKYRDLFENAPVGIFRTHSSGYALMANSTIAGILGFSSPKEAVTHYSNLDEQLFENREIRKELLRNLGEHGYVEDFEFPAKTYDGQTVWLNVNARKVPDGYCDDSFFIDGFAADITKRKSAEEKKAQLEEQFYQAQKMESIGRLAGGVAHDLNNLLTPILGYAEILLEDNSLDGGSRDVVEEIVGAGRRAQTLIRQLLAFSRKQSLQFERISVNELVKDFEKLLCRTLREDIEIFTKLAPSAPLIKGDMGQLEQVIMNLAVNAQDAMPQGGELSIETAVTVLDESYADQKKGVKPGSYVMLAVNDTGSGMDAYTIERLFEPFFTTKEKGKGTGLGMSTAYGIIKQHGGNIWAYSEPGYGTTVKIYLPALTGSRDKEASDDQEEAELTGDETILLVEDDQQVRELASTVLKRFGYSVFAAEDGQDALSIVNRHENEIHLLLTDVIMPDMDGKELFERISGIYTHVRVLFMSGYTNDVIANHGVIDENVDFIQKPFSIKALAAKVREVLDK